MVAAVATVPKHLLVVSRPGAHLYSYVSPAQTPTAVPGIVRQIPSKIDLGCYAGDDFEFSIELFNADSTPADLTGASALAQIRQYPGSGVVVAEFVVTIDAAVLTLKLPNADSQNMVGVYVWDCQVTYIDGLVSTVAGGRLSVTQDVSRP